MKSICISDKWEFWPQLLAKLSIYIWHKTFCIGKAVGSASAAGNRQQNDSDEKSFPPVVPQLNQKRWGDCPAELYSVAQCAIISLDTPLHVSGEDDHLISSPIYWNTNHSHHQWLNTVSWSLVVHISHKPSVTNILFYSFFQCSSPVSVDPSSPLVRVVKYRPILSLSWEKKGAGEWKGEGGGGRRQGYEEMDQRGKWAGWWERNLVSSLIDINRLIVRSILQDQKHFRTKRFWELPQKNCH